MARSNRTVNFLSTVKTFRSATDLLSEALFLIDRSHRIILANSAAKTMTGLAESALLDQRIESILSMKLPKQTKFGQLDTESAAVVSVPAIIHEVTHSATFVPLANLTYLAQLKPRPYALVIVTPKTPSRMHDHTTATIYLQIIGQLTMRIAHDLNNSLTSIIGNAELIREQLDDALPELDDVIRKSRQMAQFIDRLQRYARQRPFTTLSLDLNTAISDFLRIAKSLLGPTIQINFLPADELPPIYMDRPRIDQVLLSILLTCRKEMPSGGLITIETECANLDAEFIRTHRGARPGPYSRLSITDSGNGMDSNQLARIFDFPTSELLDSASLGLPIAYSIVKEFGGYIAVESWVGRGTRFDIYLPSLPVTLSSSPIDETLAPTSLKNSQQSVLVDSSLILVADDDADIQRTIARSVSRAGYETIFAADGKAALDLFKRLTAAGRQPALLIADLGLPEIDGRTLSITIQQEFRFARILLTSGYKIDINPATSETPEGFTFLQKPFEPSALLITINQLLKNDDAQNFPVTKSRSPGNYKQRKHKKRDRHSNLE